VYTWIWRNMPFDLPGKIIASVVGALTVGILLWYGVFPAAEPLLPFGDVQVTDGGGAGTGNAVTPTDTPQPNR
jgi:hypothetical protein